jgi:ATP-dependent DNA helicase RecG
MDEIPNKAVNHLGVVVDVNLHKKGSKHFIEIVVPENTVPISFHGVYHYRSGSTKQELKGPALHKFLLEKIGISWEQQVLPTANIDDIDDDTIKRFLKKAIQHKRISEHASSSDTLTLLRNLELINDKGVFLLAALLLFGKEHHSITNTAYQTLNDLGKSLSTVELQGLLDKKIIEKIGTTGRGTKYVLSRSNGR